MRLRKRRAHLGSTLQARLLSSNLKCPSEPRLLEVGDAQGGAVLPFFVCSLREGVVIPPGQGL